MATANLEGCHYPTSYSGGENHVWCTPSIGQDSHRGCLVFRIHSAGCCAIGECGLDCTELLPSLPAQGDLFRLQFIVAKEKPLVLHLCAGAGHPISDVMREALTILLDSTHCQHRMHVHCYTGDLDSYQHWDEKFTLSPCHRCLHLRAGAGHPIFDVMREALTILLDSTHRQRSVKYRPV